MKVISAELVYTVLNHDGYIRISKVQQVAFPSRGKKQQQLVTPLHTHTHPIKKKEKKRKERTSKSSFQFRFVSQDSNSFNESSSSRGKVYFSDKRYTWYSTAKVCVVIHALSVRYQHVCPGPDGDLTSWPLLGASQGASGSGGGGHATLSERSFRSHPPVSSTPSRLFADSLPRTSERPCGHRCMNSRALLCRCF